jgi:transcriptional regulator with XRE-family HTH domain
MKPDITPESLKSWRKAEKLNQARLAEMIGWKPLIVTNIETGRREISEPEQRLLRLLIYGEMPFERSQGPFDPQIEFTDSEWSLMTRLANRDGAQSTRKWIVEKIRAYLAMTFSEDHHQAQLLKVAEELDRSTIMDTPPPAYPKKINEH